MPYVLPINGPIFVREDWDDTGNFDGTYDDLSADLLPSVSVERGRDQARVIGAPKVPAGDFRLNNESRQYATTYSGSPLHDKIRPGHLVQFGRFVGDIEAEWEDPDIEWDDVEAMWEGAFEALLLTGYAEEQRETFGLGRRVVDVSAYGSIRRLVDLEVSVAYQAAITTGAAMQMLWDAVSLATGIAFEIDADEIANGYELLHWYVDRGSAWEATKRIWATAGPPSAVYERPDGTLVFEGKSYRTDTVRSNTVQATYTDLEVGGLWLADVQYEPSYASVVNAMTLGLQLRAAEASQQVWEYGGVLVLGNAEVRQIFVHNDSNDPWINPVTPASPTDFTVSPGSLASVTLTPLGQTFLVTFTAGPGGATINPTGSNGGFSLRAQPVTVVSTQSTSGTVDTSDSQASYGPKSVGSEITGAIWPSLSPAEADSLVDGYLLQYQEPRALVTVTLEGATGELLTEIVTREVSDRIHVIDSWSGIDLDVSIEQVEHAIDADTRHTCVLSCERIVEFDWGRWDVAQWDVDRWGQ